MELRYTRPKPAHKCSPSLRFTDAEAMIRSRKVQRPLDTVGAELRCALTKLAEQEPQQANTLIGSYQAKLRLLMFRPACEPILLSYTDTFKRWVFAENMLKSLVSCLLGRQAGIARGRMRGSSLTGTDVSFSSSLSFDSMTSELQWLEMHIRNPFTFASSAFALTVLSHIFEDGNGRLARAIFYGSLCRRGLVSAPWLPTAPYFYESRDEIAAGLALFSKDGDLSALTVTLTDLLRRCARERLSAEQPTQTSCHLDRPRL